MPPGNAFCFSSVAEDPALALYWLDQITSLLNDIGADGRAEIVRRMFELKGFDMSGTPQPNVGEFYLTALMAIRERLKAAPDMYQHPGTPCQ